MANEIPLITYWDDSPLHDLSKEELIEVINELAVQIKDARNLLRKMSELV